MLIFLQNIFLDTAWARFNGARWWSLPRAHMLTHEVVEVRDDPFDVLDESAAASKALSKALDQKNLQGVGRSILVVCLKRLWILPEQGQRSLGCRCAPWPMRADDDPIVIVFQHSQKPVHSGFRRFAIKRCLDFHAGGNGLARQVGHDFNVGCAVGDSIGRCETLVINELGNSRLQPSCRIIFQLSLDDGLDRLANMTRELQAQVTLLLEPARDSLFDLRRRFLEGSVVRHRLDKIFPSRPHLREALDAGARVIEEAEYLVEQEGLLLVFDRFLDREDFTLGCEPGPRPVIEANLLEKGLGN